MKGLAAYPSSDGSKESENDRWENDLPHPRHFAVNLNSDIRLICDWLMNMIKAFSLPVSPRKAPLNLNPDDVIA